METGSRSSRKIVWIVISLITFIAIEIFLGGVIGPLLSGRFVGHVFSLKIEIFLMLISYFFGGLLVGLISPGIRIFEPAVGAALAVFFTCAYSFFTPLRFYGFRFNQMAIGAIIAFVLALLGADLGERLAARLGNRESQRYARH